MITLPQNRIWTQNKSELMGQLFSTFNLNLTEEYGKTKISPQMLITTNNITDLGVGVNFKIIASKIWTIAGSYIFKTANTRTGSAFAKDAITGTPTTCSSDVSDLEIYNQNLFVTTNDGTNSLLYSISGTGNWATATNGGLTTGVFHKLLTFRFKNRLYVTDSGAVYSLTGTTLTKSGEFTFTFGLGLIGLNITSLLQTDSHIWILTINPSSVDPVGNNGVIIKWDGDTADTPVTGGIIPLDSRGALAGIVKDGTPYIITVDGRLQFFNGSVFTDVAYNGIPNGKLPIKLNKYLKNPFNALSTRWIHPNGISIVEGRINILINNEYYDASTSIDERVASGIWEYDPIVGWYHKKSLSLFDTSVGTVKDYGQNRLSRVGALVNLKTDNNSSDTYIGTLLAGAQYFSDATTTATGIWTDDSTDTIQKYGYLVTSKLFSPVNEDNFNRLFIRIKKLLSATDKIVVKYRSSVSNSTEGTITWISTTGFTTALNISLFAVGDEVEVTQGTGSGKCAHITAIQTVSGGYMVELDETFPSVTGTAKARFQKWNKLTSLTSTSFDTIKIGTIATARWIQLKICLLCTGDDELYDIIIENTPSTNG